MKPPLHRHLRHLASEGNEKNRNRIVSRSPAAFRFTSNRKNIITETLEPVVSSAVSWERQVQPKASGGVKRPFFLMTSPLIRCGRNERKLGLEEKTES
jgi:hypothetical protein